MRSAIPLTIGYAIMAGIACAKLLGCVPWFTGPDANEISETAGKLAVCQAEGRKAAEQCQAGDAGLNCDREAILQYNLCKRDSGL